MTKEQRETLRVRALKRRAAFLSQAAAMFREAAQHAEDGATLRAKVLVRQGAVRLTKADQAISKQREMESANATG